MESANRAAALTHRLLAFSRRQPLDPDPSTSTGWWRRWRICSAGPSARPSTSRSCERTDCGCTLCDPNQLESALLNLCHQCARRHARWRQAHDRDRQQVARRARRADAPALPPGEYVCICVTDTGIGMTPEVVARAFDPFFTTKPIGQGTGLGPVDDLRLCAPVGRPVRIDSEVGQGTTVRLYLPRHHGEAADRHAAAPAAAEHAAAGETVLVVEDEPTVRMLIAGDAGGEGLPDAARRATGRRA